MAKGLGKGLGAFFSEVEQQKGEHMTEVPLKDCRPNPYQPRKHFQEESILELKHSIEEHGVLQPLIVRRSIKGYEIVAGERRYRAAKMAGLTAVPAIIREMSDQQMMEIALLENLQREDLTVIEEAKAYQNLMNELDITQDMLANRIGKSRSHIANFVRLLSLPADVIKRMDDGGLSMGHGRALLSLKDRKKLLPLVEKIEKEGLNVRQVERMVYDYNQEKREKKKENKRDIFLKEQEEHLKQRLGTGVTIHKGKRKGKIEIEFMNEDDLERILKWFDSPSEK
ncbi:ParB/RepB/Spo0J family partition protein [Halobacillus yeomjeoni]|uniref:ParB/RepB/Spo0J family partition protein n=1 Tax=Halobacillus yeomjeoni TaxID=311194 RepID=A0A931HVI7_9BACI|nr:ParB/RepB/Spo0J family partition protein [Halobacillus yeomjeoni]MBH0230260.1 ParB/RepB/Spo0J family partition protein [Halobacillus yeomjeoni]